MEIKSLLLSLYIFVCILAHMFRKVMSQTCTLKHYAQR